MSVDERRELMREELGSVRPETEVVTVDNALQIKEAPDIRPVPDHSSETTFPVSPCADGLFDALLCESQISSGTPGGITGPSHAPEFRGSRKGVNRKIRAYSPGPRGKLKCATCRKRKQKVLPSHDEH